MRGNRNCWPNKGRTGREGERKGPILDKERGRKGNLRRVILDTQRGKENIK